MKLEIKTNNHYVGAGEPSSRPVREASSEFL